MVSSLSGPFPCQLLSSLHGSQLCCRWEAPETRQRKSSREVGPGSLCKHCGGQLLCSSARVQEPWFPWEHGTFLEWVGMDHIGECWRDSYNAVFCSPSLTEEMCQCSITMGAAPRSSHCHGEMHLGWYGSYTTTFPYAPLSKETFWLYIPDSQHLPGESAGPGGMSFSSSPRGAPGNMSCFQSWSPGSILTAGEGSLTVTASWGAPGCHST